MSSWFTSIAVGLISAVCGAVSVGYLATRCVRWYRISSFEGQSGYFVIMLGLLGAVGGLVVGVVASRWVARAPGAGFLTSLGAGVGLVLGLTLVAGVLAWLAADIPPERDGRSLQIEVELLLPPGTGRPAAVEGFTPSFSILKGDASRSGGGGGLNLAEARQENGRWVIPGQGALLTSSASKTVWVSLQKQLQLHFPIPLRRRPVAADEAWTPWRAVGSIYENGSWTRPHGEPTFSLRYRVRIWEPPPAPIAGAADDVSPEQAAFDAIAPDAGVREWLPYTRRGKPPQLQEAALARITGRPTYVAELTALERDDDAEVAADALRLVSELPQPSPALVPGVAQAGSDIATRLAAVVKLTPEQDPSYEGAAGISVRFSAWIGAAQRLRDCCRADLVPELRAILLLARERPDSHALTQDVVRVASYYLQQWTGEAPAPSDPPPR